MDEFTKKRKVNEIVENLDTILDEDYCMIGSMFEKCEICGKQIKVGDRVVFMNSGLAVLYDDVEEQKLAINNLKNDSFIWITHFECQPESNRPK